MRPEQVLLNSPLLLLANASFQMPLATFRLVPFDCLYAIFNHRSTTGGCTGEAGHGLGVSQAGCSDYGCHMLSYRVSHPRKGTAWKESQRETKRKEPTKQITRYPHGPKPTHTHTPSTVQLCHCHGRKRGTIIRSIYLRLLCSRLDVGNKYLPPIGNCQQCTERIVMGHRFFIFIFSSQWGRSWVGKKRHTSMRGVRVMSLQKLLVAG